MEEKKIIEEIEKTYNLIKSSDGKNAFYINMGFIKCLHDTSQIDYNMFGKMLRYNYDYSNKLLQ